MKAQSKIIPVLGDIIIWNDSDVRHISFRILQCEQFWRFSPKKYFFYL